MCMYRAYIYLRLSLSLLSLEIMVEMKWISTVSVCVRPFIAQGRIIVSLGLVQSFLFIHDTHFHAAD